MNKWTGTTQEVNALFSNLAINVKAERWSPIALLKWWFVFENFRTSKKPYKNLVNFVADWEMGMQFYFDSKYFTDFSVVGVNILSRQL